MKRWKAAHLAVSTAWWSGALVMGWRYGGPDGSIAWLGVTAVIATVGFIALDALWPRMEPAEVPRISRTRDDETGVWSRDPNGQARDSTARYMPGPNSVVISARGDNPLWQALGVDTAEPPDDANGARSERPQPIDEIIAHLQTTRGTTH